MRACEVRQMGCGYAGRSGVILSPPLQQRPLPCAIVELRSTGFLAEKLATDWKVAAPRGSFAGLRMTQPGPRMTPVGPRMTLHVPAHKHWGFVFRKQHTMHRDFAERNVAIGIG